MSGKTFVDSNVLVYAHDVRQGAKHEMAKRTLRSLWEERTGSVSMQVLQEFYVTVTRKLPRPLPRTSARFLVEEYAAWCVETTPLEITAAFRIEDEAKISFWDALILAAAQKSGAVRLLSEDLNPGQKIAGIRIENPFAQLA
jgi:predicted nucleic acid-binding protein